MENSKEKIINIMVNFAVEVDDNIDLLLGSLNKEIGGISNLMNEDESNALEVLQLFKYSSSVISRVIQLGDILEDLPDSVGLDNFFAKAYILGFLDNDFKVFNDCVINKIVEYNKFGAEPRSI